MATFCARCSCPRWIFAGALTIVIFGAIPQLRMVNNIYVGQSSLRRGCTSPKGGVNLSIQDSSWLADRKTHPHGTLWKCIGIICFSCMIWHNKTVRSTGISLTFCSWVTGGCPGKHLGCWMEQKIKSLAAGVHETNVGCMDKNLYPCVQ